MKRFARTILLVLSSAGVIGTGAEFHSRHTSRERWEHADVPDSTRDYLTGLYGEGVIFTLEGQAQHTLNGPGLPDRAEAAPRSTMGFERTETVASDTTGYHRLFVETYPKGWTDRVDHLIFDPDTTVAIGTQYGIPGARVAGFYEPHGKTGDIRLFGADEWTSSYVFSHEMGHANDWHNVDYGTVRERAELLARASRQLFEDEHAFVTPYVAEIDSTQRELRVQEYWAELCQAFFEYPTILARDHPRDFQLISEFVMSQDPSFDVRAASEDRDRLRWNRQRRETIIRFPEEVQRNVANIIQEAVKAAGPVASSAPEAQQQACSRAGHWLNGAEYARWFDAFCLQNGIDQKTSVELDDYIRSEVFTALDVKRGEAHP